MRLRVALTSVGTAVGYRNRIPDPTLVSCLRSGIAPPRRDLPFRGAEEGILWKTTKEWWCCKVQRGRGVAAWGGVGIAVSYRNRVSGPTPFGVPTGGIASPRRDLPIPGAEALIARGLPRVCSFLGADPPEGFNEDPTSPISGNKIDS